VKESVIKPSADEIESLFAAADTEADRIEAEQVKAALDHLFIWHQRFKNDDFAASLGEVAYRLAQLYGSGQAGSSRPDLAEGFGATAAALGHFGATYALAVQYPQTLERVQAAFDLGLDRLPTVVGDEQRKTLADQLLNLVRYATAIDPRLAVRWVGQLIGIVLDHSLLAPLLPQVRSVGEQVVSVTGGGVYVIEAISPSKDRAVAEVLKRYQVRLELPTPLAPVPDLQNLQLSLNEEFPWFGRVTDWVIQQLSARALGRGYFQLSPLLLLGDPGLGKSSYVNRLGQLSKVPVQLISLGGKADS
jgi:hypothetical protein